MRNQITVPEFDNTQAHSEGWAIFQVGSVSNLFQLCKDDEMGIFQSDYEAQQFVVHKALAGSEYHQEALGYLMDHSPAEYASIEDNAALRHDLLEDFTLRAENQEKA